jgi:DNA-binding CsgD family transcriptional regulator
MMDWLEGRRRWLLAATAALLLALMLAGEALTSDEPLWSLDLLLDLVNILLLVGTTVACTLLALRLGAHEEETRLLRADMALVRAESLQWREEMADELRALGQAIRRQFEVWRLTAAEQEVGLLLLKGFSHKEIARLRGTSEATIRQQAAAIYQKSNLGGRAALSAFFLEDLLAETGASPIAAAPVGVRPA